jgi:amino acid adenylation domain-containing protein
MEILLSAELSPEANCSYNESFTLQLEGPLDQAALTESLNTLLARHEALRATFDLESRTQYFAAPAPIDLPVIDLSALDATAQQSKLAALVAEDARNPFNLKTGPLVRMSLLRLAPQRHSLMVTAHHVVCDGWSINVLLNELSILYNARVADATPTLDPLMLFSAYAQSQEAHFAGPEGAANEAYWVDKFSVLPPLLNLPVDHARPAMKSFGGATYYRKIALDDLKELRRAGAKQKCTLFVTLLSGFSALLGRLSGQDDIVVGIPSAGQSLVEDKTLVGHCVNFAPIRTLPSEDDSLTVADFLNQTRKAVFDAYDHQNYTFGRLVRKLSIPRDSSRLPLVEVQFNLEKVGEGLTFTGLKSAVVSNPKSFVNFDIFLNAVEGTDGLSLQVDYNTALIDEATIARWMDAYEQLLKGIAADATQPLYRLPLLTASERDLVTHAFNHTGAAYPTDLCVHQLFERQAAAVPQSIALEFESESLTYAELNARANRLARYLISSGVTSGEVLGIYMERSVEMVVALLATWKAGATYVPLDPTFPADRIAMVFEDLVNPIVLTQTRVAAQLPASGARVLRVDELWPIIEVESPLDLGLAYNPTTLAYVIYTSGSTGRPKGVEVTQANVVNLLTSMAKKPGFTSADILVAVTTISFDIAALEVYLPLVTGAKLVLASRAAASDGNELLKLLRASKATVMQATPITFRLLLAAGWTGDPEFTAWCGGEALPRDLANQILRCNIPLWNMYGPTETTIWSAVDTVASGSGPVLVGPPIDNTQFYVLDAHQQLVPLGVAGELYIGGDGVANGYYKRPDLTAARFLPDPFTAKPGAAIYRTGDLVRLLPSGRLEFLGRADGQIKLRGFRIELGEIETALASHKSLEQAVVTLREDVPGDKRLVAYLIPSNGSLPAGSEFRDYLLSRLPDYMVPSAFIPLTTFPLTANGKIDRRALPAPDLSTLSNGSSYVAPGTAQEEQFAAIWAEVLHLPRVGVQDNIFELGADSLHVFQIAARANKAGIDVTPRQILQLRTISAVLADSAIGKNTSRMTPITPVSRAKYRVSLNDAPDRPKSVEAAELEKR